MRDRYKIRPAVKDELNDYIAMPAQGCVVHDHSNDRVSDLVRLDFLVRINHLEVFLHGGAEGSRIRVTFHESGKRSQSLATAPGHV